MFAVLINDSRLSISSRNACESWFFFGRMGFFANIPAGGRASGTAPLIDFREFAGSFGGARQSQRRRRPDVAASISSECQQKVLAKFHVDHGW